jgi:drug/metabolite transporter (DMT)-like permease
VTTTSIRARSPRPSPIPATRSWGIALAFMTATISGVAIFTNGYAVRRFDGSAPFTTGKNLVAAVALAALAVALTSRRSREGWTSPRTAGERFGLVAVGLVGGSVPFLLFFEGLSRAASSDAAFLHKTLVVWVALLGIVFLRERIGWPHVVAISAIVGGQLLLTSDLTAIGLGSGEVLIFAATLLWSVEVVVAKRLLAHLSPLTVGVSRMGIGSVALVAWLAVTGQLSDMVGYSASQWGWIVLTGALLTGYVATWYSGLARAQAIDVTAVLVFGAVITAALSGAFAGASVRPDLVGLAMLATGSAIVALVPPRRGLAGA